MPDTSTPSLPDRLIDRPFLVLALACALQLAGWTLAPALAHHAPPLDVVESYLWGREWVWATFKHPSFPGWALEISRLVTGATGWPAYLLSQLGIVASFLLIFALGRDLFGRDRLGTRRALAGVLLLTGVFYFSWPTPEWNHNVPQIPVFAALLLCLWRATTRGDLIWWLLLGVAAALSMQVKYSSGVLLVVAGVWVLADAAGRRQVMRPGPWLALAVFLAGLAPQVWWVVQSGFLPLEYAARRSAAGGGPLDFLLTQVANHAVLLLLAALAGLFGRRALEGWPHPGGLERRAVNFLLLMGLGPVLLAALMSAFSGSGLKDMWATGMFTLSGLLLVALTAGRFGDRALTRIMAGAGLLLVLLPLAYAASVPLGPQITGKPARVNWPARAIADRLQAEWAARMAAPLRIVAGDEWLAGLVALDVPAASIFTHADRRLSPWITPERVAEQGALVVWRETGGGVPERMAWLAQQGVHQGELAFPFPGQPDLAPVRVGYVLVPPQR